MQLNTEQKWILVLLLNVVICLAYCFFFIVGDQKNPPRHGGYGIIGVMVLACWQFAINVVAIITYFILKSRNENGKVGLAYLLGFGIVGLIGFSFCSTM